MSLVFFFLKIFPFFGIALTVLFFDLARTFKRRGNRAWMGMILFGIFSLGLTAAWVYYRGDKNADRWFGHLVAWLHQR